MEYTTQAKESKMAKQQKTYTREFKVEAVQLVKSSGKPMSQIARELGISGPGREERRVGSLVRVRRYRRSSSLLEAPCSG